MATMEALDTAAERLYSADDLWALAHSPEYLHNRLELSKGKLMVMSPTGWKHGDVSNRTAYRITAFADQHDLGMVTAAETGFVLRRDPVEGDIVRAPDVGFILKEKISPDLPNSYVPFAPDLVVEVVLPGDSADDIQEKVSEYLRCGTRLVWVVYPKTKTVVVHTPDGARTLRAEDTLDGGDVLPGLSLLVSDIFR